MTSRRTTRARDIDRSNTCTLLDAGYGEGQLDFEEHKSRTAAAMSARTLGELESLVTDLQLPAALTDTLPEPEPASPRRLPLKAGIAAAAVAVAAVALVQLNRDGPDPAPAAAAPLVPAPAAPAPAPPDAYSDVAPVVITPIDTLTAGGIEQFRDKFRKKFGDTLVYDVNFFDDYVSITRMMPGQPDREQDYSFRGGFQADTATSHSGDEPPFDLASVDLNALAGHLLGAAESLHVPGGTISHIRMEVEDGDPQVTVFVGNDATGASGHMYLRPNGEIAAVYPYSPTG
ncbi:DUF1707 SHOCT-like domain-containing protein [Rhodococcus daqingensis]|uniref:DUF1707 domain-containing protein n=1 Tax=Rhodococcus daqingensis TaxID=2479363 RepID=A0ABW2RXF4_9NOCA